jgi:protein-disulfide isomerase
MLMMKGLALFALLIAAMVFFSGCTDKVKLGNPNIAGEPFRGGANAKVTIVEFSDFECPFCGRAYLVDKEIEAAYGNRIKSVFKHFPLSNLHPQAQKAAEASECAAAQGRFWEMHDVLFQNQNALDIASLKKYAQNLQLNSLQFDACLDRGETAPAIAKDYQEGGLLGVEGTPTYFINGKMYVGYLSAERLKQIIDGELAAAK